ncbi:GM11992 [Drosophila sechellia]|uniref:GM11992 n=1 Tax=Drosophila sechellia TaxID=7238 RepID=B4IL67_DROSE|nr:GM11992 [Drosophila sechellia]
MPLQLSSQDGIWPARSRRLHQHHQLAYHHQKQQQQQKQKQNGVQQGRSPTFMPVMLLLLMATLLTRPLSAFSNQNKDKSILPRSLAWYPSELSRSHLKYANA